MSQRPTKFHEHINGARYHAHQLRLNSRLALRKAGLSLRAVPSYRPLRRIETNIHRPLLVKTSVLSHQLPVPYFVLREDRTYADDRERLTVMLSILKARNIFADDLLYCGFKGWPVIRAGSFGSRSQTYAMPYRAVQRGIISGWRNRKYHNTPFLHMDVTGGRMPAVAVFKPDGLAGGEYFHEEDALVPDHSRNAWWTRDGSSLDKACVAIFVFKRCHASQAELRRVKRWTH